MVSNAFAPHPPASETTTSGWAHVLRRRLAGLITRLLSLLMLCAVLSGLVYAGLTAYHVAMDSFVAPIILTPDNDMVIQSKLSLSRLLAERSAINVRIAANNAGAEEAGKALDQLNDLKQVSGKSLDWSTAIASQQASVGATDLYALSKKDALLAEMIDRQTALAEEMRKSLELGLVHKSDVARQDNLLSELRVAALQNERDRLASGVRLNTALLTGQAVKTTDASRGLNTPEMLLQKDQLVRIELEIIKLAGERRAKVAQVHSDEQELATLDELISQMKARPLFRAIDSSQNVAFVPYTQISGVRPGATVYDCAIWGIFACNPVGKIAELLPGEVAMQDPWGTLARGRYAILDLSVPQAAQSKALRVRDHGRGIWPPPWTETGDPSLQAARTESPAMDIETKTAR